VGQFWWEQPLTRITQRLTLVAKEAMAKPMLLLVLLLLALPVLLSVLLLLGLPVLILALPALVVSVLAVLALMLAVVLAVLALALVLPIPQHHFRRRYIRFVDTEFAPACLASP
jgi:hypothetical protein